MKIIFQTQREEKVTTADAFMILDMCMVDSETILIKYHDGVHK